jgi:hypothetical protein
MLKAGDRIVEIATGRPGEILYVHRSEGNDWRWDVRFTDGNRELSAIKAFLKEAELRFVSRPK